MKPGDVVTGESGKRWKIAEQLAYQGKEDCTDPRCTRRGADWMKGDMGICMGWHCPVCDAPCSSMGHKCPEAQA